MKFKLTIDCDNAAFEDDPADEVRTILLSMVDVVFVDKGYEHHVLDSNGNTVGKWSLR